MSFITEELKGILGIRDETESMPTVPITVPPPPEEDIAAREEGEDIGPFDPRKFVKLGKMTYLKSDIIRPFAIGPVSVLVAKNTSYNNPIQAGIISNTDPRMNLVFDEFYIMYERAYNQFTEGLGLLSGIRVVKLTKNARKILIIPQALNFYPNMPETDIVNGYAHPSQKWINILQWPEVIGYGEKAQFEMYNTAADVDVKIYIHIKGHWEKR